MKCILFQEREENPLIQKCHPIGLTFLLQCTRPKNAVDNWPKAANLLEAVKWWRFLCLRSSTHYYYLSCVWKIRDAKNGAILEFEALQKMQLFTMFENHWKKSYFQYCKRRNLNFRAKKINFEQELKWEIFADFETLCFFSKVQNR